MYPPFLGFPPSLPRSAMATQEEVHPKTAFASNNQNSPGLAIAGWFFLAGMLVFFIITLVTSWNALQSGAKGLGLTLAINRPHLHIAQQNPIPSTATLRARTQSTMIRTTSGVRASPVIA